jgi:general secretion pathway protein K
MTGHQTDERGFALVMVLWAAVILALLAGGVAAMARTGIWRAQHQTREDALRTIADGALNLVLLQIVDPRGAAPPPVDGTPFDVTFDSRVVHLTVQDEAGKIDLNAAPATALQAVLAANGLDESAAEALTDKVLDWRELGVGKRLYGAKAEDYRAAGYAYGPRQGFFPRVEELKLVMGMTRALYDRIAPVLTVYSQSPSVDPQVAPPEVLRLLPGMDEEAVQRLMDARTQGDTALGQLPGRLPGRVLIGHAFTIIASVRSEEGTTVISTAIIRLVGQPQSPFWVYRWD